MAPPYPQQEPAAEPFENGLTAAILGATETALFENLYSAYAAEACRMALAMLGDAGLAADAVHTAFLEILRMLLSGKRWYDPATARAAVLRNSRWAALNQLRALRRRREQALESTGASAAAGMPDEWARSEARALCEQVVARLRAGDRQVLHLRYVEALSNAEAAGRLDVSEKAMELRVARAVARARRLARTAGILPALVPWAPMAVDVVRGAMARVRRMCASTRRVGGAAASAAAVALAAFAAGAWAQGAGGASDHLIRPRPVAAAMVETALPERVEDTIFVDALVVHAGLPANVLGLGRDAGCGCWLLWSSTDGGWSWTRAQVGAAAERAFNAAAVNRGAGQHALPCGGAIGVPYCFGHTGSTAGSSGLVLRRDPSHILYFSPVGGVRATADGGRSWVLAVGG